MKITKYAHSCLLAETADRVALIDPGEFSWQSPAFNLAEVERIDRIIVTHKHGDHFDPEFIKAVVKKIPEVHLVANEEVTEVAKKAGITATFRGLETGCAKPFKAPHEQLPIPGADVPANTGYHFQDMLTHPGDSHSFNETKDILALPVIAPWGSTVRAVELALELKPKYVLPIHDWHYSAEARSWLYDLLEAAFEGSGISFVKLKDGEPFEYQ